MMAEQAAVRGAAVLVVFLLFGQVLSKSIMWDTLPATKSSYRDMSPKFLVLIGSKVQAHNKTQAVATLSLYPQLAVAAGCRQLIEDIAEPDSWTGHSKMVDRCSDELCLVEALLARTPFIIIEQDIGITGPLPLPDVTTKVTIVGKCPLHYPCVIDGMGMGQIFIVGISGELTLKNLAITGAYCSDGAAVLVTGSGSSMPGTSGKLLATNVLFFNNTATGKGGAIMVKAGGALHVRSSVFDKNKAMHGGAVYVGASDDSDPAQAGCGLSSCVTFVNTAFTRNWADMGGAVYVDDATIDCAQYGGAKMECTTCIFQKNSATYDGGALLMAWMTSGSIGHVKMSSFVNNTAGRSGGAVEIQEARPFIQGVEFNAYQTKFKSPPNEIAVAVKRNANATFTHCHYTDLNSVACEGGMCQFCPAVKPWAHPKTLFDSSAQMQPMCPGPPPPLCDWVPPECAPLMSPPMMSPPMSPPMMSPPMSPPMMSPPMSPPMISPPMSPPPPPPSPSPPPPSPPPPSPSPPPPSPPPPSPPPPSPPPPSPSPPPPSPPPPSPSPPPPSPPPPSPSPPPPSPPPPSPSPPPPSPPPPSPPPPSPPPPSPSPPPPSPPPPSPSPPPPSPPPPSPPPPSPPPPPTWKTLPINAPPPSIMVQDAPNAPPPPAPASPCVCKCPTQTPRHAKRSGVVYGDPHFYGKHGEHFDFHGRSGRDYCVVTDKDLHINMHIFQGLQKGVTFISMVGMLYEEDVILVNAQAHRNASHLSNQWAVNINNVELSEGKRYNNPLNGLEIICQPSEVHMHVRNVINFTVTTVRATFGSRGSGANYLNFKINYLNVSPTVHGLLGQTYQETKRAYQKLHEARRAKTSRASSLLLDGTDDDYLTTGILAPDCKFANFEERKTFTGKVQRKLVGSAQSLFPFMAPEKLVAQGCTGGGDSSICHDDMD